MVKEKAIEILKMGVGFPKDTGGAILRINHLAGWLSGAILFKRPVRSLCNDIARFLASCYSMYTIGRDLPGPYEVFELAEAIAFKLWEDMAEIEILNSIYGILGELNSIVSLACRRGLRADDTATLFLTGYHIKDIIAHAFRLWAVIKQPPPPNC